MAKRIVYTKKDESGNLLGRVYFDPEFAEYTAKTAAEIGQPKTGYFTDDKSDAIATLGLLIKAEQARKPQQPAPMNLTTARSLIAEYDRMMQTIIDLYGNAVPNWPAKAQQAIADKHAEINAKLNPATAGATA